MDYYSEFKYGFNKLIPNSKSNDRQNDIADVLSDGDGFLNFNYTWTLERVYEIDECSVCHVHGRVGDSSKEIFLGHGEEDGVSEAFGIMGAESNLSLLKRSLYKDTAKAWNRHTDFFDRIGDELGT
ncbi:MAG: hypothetical protein IJ733_14085 [Lachnospiraceae bacterium]|nr:hypothetical protein [Lachnospiraceae bacterium]